jgi:hypothetical protein
MTFAMVECSDGEWRPAMGGKRWSDDSSVWVFADGKYRDRGESNSRPVAVIDPEDDTTLSRLWRLLPDSLVSIDQLQYTLREFADPKPPKPEEPTGLGAVVVDTGGCRWVRFSAKTGPWWRNHSGSNLRYSNIDAVEVLSHGVPE